MSDSASVNSALRSCRKLHFIGIGGISMSSIAAISRDRGYIVSGSDDDGENPLLPHLRSLGIEIRIPLSGENIDEFTPDAVIFTAAIHEDNPELKRARLSGALCLTRAEFLGWIMTEYETRIGISGTHGKSTTTAMVYSIHDAARSGATLCCGAVVPSVGGAYAIGQGKDFIYEACEYTDSFLSFFPTSAVILNIELDHTDYFTGIEMLISSFRKSIEPADKVFTLYGSETCLEAVKDTGKETFFISPDCNKADYYGENIGQKNGRYSFDVMKKGEKLARVNLSVPGIHNLSNALFAFAVCHENGIEAEKCKEGLEKFTGIDRRFQKIGEYKGRDVYIDYAHHPGEIKTTIATARETFKGRLFVVFQSHTHTRTAEFVKEFAEELSKCDEVIITHTYAAREALNDTGVSAEDLAGMISCGRYIGSFEGAVDYIVENGQENDTYIFMGAGNINKAAFMLCEKDKEEK